MTSQPSPAQSSLLERYVDEVAAVIDRQLPVLDTVQGVLRAQQRLMDADFRLPEAYRAMAPGVPYTRNLVHQDPENRFAVVAIVWGPFQETRIHDHLNWCVVGVMEGMVHAIDYDRLDRGTDAGRAELQIRQTSLQRPGSILALTPPPRTNIHKMANAAQKSAISLHTYGDPGTKARVFDPVAGSVEIVDLEFHNL